MVTLQNLSSFVAASDIHISLKAEKILQVGPLAVTNSMIYGVVSAVVIGALLIWAARKIKVRGSKGFPAVVEVLVEFLLTLLEGPLGSRARAIKYAPVLGTFFVFILFNNLLGLLPLVGPGLTVDTPAGHTPLFRPFTADLNGTIAMAVIAILLVQFLSIKEQGGKNHLKHYFSDKPWNPINFFIGLIEVFGEFTRIVSLALRLFLNTAVGEILIAVFTSLVAANGRTPLAAIPIFLFEVLVAGIQAYVFTILTTTYLGLATAHHNEHHDDDHEASNKKVEAEAHS